MAYKIVVVAVICALLGGVIWIKQTAKNKDTALVSVPEPVSKPEVQNNIVVEKNDPESLPDVADVKKKLPCLLDLGAGKCIPCKMMEPVLHTLKDEYQGRMDVVFIDVWENQEAAASYGIRSIPTQIFLDAGGKELYRHEGFFSKEEILSKWVELGIQFEQK